MTVNNQKRKLWKSCREIYHGYVLSIIYEEMQICSIEDIRLLLSRLCKVTKNDIEKIDTIREFKFERLR